MTDDRSSGFLGRGGFINFKSSDNSGRVTGIPDKKRSKNQNQAPEEQEKNKEKEELKESEYVDKSAQLKATLNSLAMLNVANVIRKDVHSKSNEFKQSENSSNPINKK